MCEMKLDKPYSLILRRVRVTIVAVKRQFVLNILSVCVCVCVYVCMYVCVCVCSLNYPVWKTYEPYCIVISGCQAIIYFSKLSHKLHDFGKRLFNIKGLIRFSYNVCRKHSSISKQFTEIITNNFTNLHRRTLNNNTGRAGGGEGSSKINHGTSITLISIWSKLERQERFV